MDLLMLFQNVLSVTWQQIVMWCIGGLLIYLAIAKDMEPSLLLPIGFGAILVNIPGVDAVQPGGALITLNREHCLGAQLRRQAALGLKAWQQVESDPKRAALTAYLGKNGDPEVDFPAEPIRLLAGDKIVLMSDGVYDVFDHEKEDGIMKKFESLETVNPQIIASVMLNTALELSGGKADDDMTVLALSVWKN